MGGWIASALHAVSQLTGIRRLTASRVKGLDLPAPHGQNNAVDGAVERRILGVIPARHAKRLVDD